MSRSSIKNYFKTGDKPTSEQISELIDEAVNLPDDSVGFTGNVRIKNKELANYNQIIPDCTNIIDFIKKVFIPFEATVLTFNTTAVIIEKGSNNSISLNGTITKNDDVGVSNAKIIKGGGESGTIIYEIPTIDPVIVFSYIDENVTDTSIYRVEVSVDDNGDPKVLISGNKTITAVIPALYGSYDSLLLNSSIYGHHNTNKNIISKPSIFQCLFNGSNKYFEASFPTTWGLPTQIIDNNGFPQTFGPAGSGADWQYISVIFSVGIWIQEMYIFYQGPTAVTNGTFKFHF